MFWGNIRQQLEKEPNQVVKVNTYNHPTLAYRAKRDIITGINPIFPEVGLWQAMVVKDLSSGFLGPRSGKMTYKHELYMVYCPTGSA